MMLDGHVYKDVGNEKKEESGRRKLGRVASRFGRKNKKGIYNDKKGIYND